MVSNVTACKSLLSLTCSTFRTDVKRTKREIVGKIEALQKIILNFAMSKVSNKFSSLKYTF